MKLPLTIDSPIFDLYFTVNRKAPHNADGGYEGLLPLRLALGHSRNIPSVKLFQAVGGENVVKPYYKSLGLESVADDQIYG
jgi:membrane peptidoglycan carboxypeptidase